MKINATFIQNNKFNKNDFKNSQNNVLNVSRASSNASCSYPSNYYLNFTSLNLNEFVAKHTESGELPSTFKNYLEDQEILLSPQEFLVLNASRPQDVQREAFAKLANCYTVDDVKKAYPSEEQFKNLKKLSDITRNGGRLFSAMKSYENKGVKTLLCDEDITTFIIKKIYYDGIRYNKVVEELKAQFTPEVKEELTRIVNSYSKASREMFEPLGIKAPDGRTYINDMQASKPRINTENSFAKATPEEINERIQKLLLGAQKARYIMMDAWNHCENARNDLSNFITEYMNDSNLAKAISETSMDIYDDKFYSKMRVIMLGFWTKYPQYKEELGKEIRTALDRYNSMPADELEQYQNSIIQKSNEIRKTIQDKKVAYRQNYPYAIEIVKTISQKANPMPAKTSSANSDFCELLLNNITKHEFEILEGDINSSEYKAFIPDGIKEKIKILYTTAQYCNIENAQEIAILYQLLAQGKINKGEIDNLINLSAQELNEYFKQGAKNINLYVADNLYEGLIDELTMPEIENVRKKLKIEELELTEAEKANFEEYFKAQGKYLHFGLNMPVLETITQVIFWQGYDKVYNSNQAQKLLGNISFEAKINTALEVLEKIDFSKF